jgi:hypothetical protein
MAVYTGQSGSIMLDNTSGAATALIEITSFTIDHTVNTIEKTAMGDQYRSYVTGMNEWSGSADLLFDSTLISSFSAVMVGNGAGEATAGGGLTLTAYPAGDTSTYPKLEGEVIVTGMSIGSEMEGMVTATISFQGTGQLAMTAVS